MAVEGAGEHGLLFGAGLATEHAAERVAEPRRGVGLADQHALGEGPGGNVQGIRGKGEDIFLQMWVGRNPSTIATQVPFLGAGVGVMKDFRIRSAPTAPCTARAGRAATSTAATS